MRDRYIEREREKERERAREREREKKIEGGELVNPRRGLSRD